MRRSPCRRTIRLLLASVAQSLSGEALKARVSPIRSFPHEVEMHARVRGKGSVRSSVKDVTIPQRGVIAEPSPALGKNKRAHGRNRRRGQGGEEHLQIRRVAESGSGL